MLMLKTIGKWGFPEFQEFGPSSLGGFIKENSSSTVCCAT
jgi:hypothetical protein